MSPSDSTHAVERRKAPRQINDLATMCSRSDPVPQWDIWHILLQLELNLLAYSLLFNKVVCLDPPSRSASSLGRSSPPYRAGPCSRFGAAVRLGILDGVYNFAASRNPLVASRRPDRP